MGTIVHTFLFDSINKQILFFKIVEKEEKEKRKLREPCELHVWSPGLPRREEEYCDHVEGEIP